MVHLYTCSSRETSILGNCKMLEVSPNSYHFGSIKLLLLQAEEQTAPREDVPRAATLQQAAPPVAPPRQTAPTAAPVPQW